MSNSLFLIFNHKLSEIQKEDARSSLGVHRIINLPGDLDQIWRQIPPDLIEIDNCLKSIKTWLSDQAAESDYVLIQGDFGATFILVNFTFEKGLIPIYSTSNREAVEEQQEDGSVKLSHRFRHQRFRRYERRFINQKTDTQE